MTQASDLAKFASEANALFNSITANTTAITAISVGGTSINSTSFAGTANNASNLGGTAAASYQLNSTLSANVATLTANNTSFVGSVSAANVVSNAQLSANLANYQTTAGLSANVATLAANSATYANASVTNTFTVGTAAYFVANGNVGIGTNSPNATLAVNGTANISSNFAVGGAISVAQSFTAISLNAAGNGFVGGTSGDNATSTVANVRLSSWFGIGFSPSITGQTVPYEENAAWINARSGDFSARGNITAYSSDRRLKKNFKQVEYALEKVMRISGYEFSWDVEKCRALGFEPALEREHGFVAQEIQQIMPDATPVAPFDDAGKGESKTGENYLTVKYEKLVVLLAEAIKEQQKQIEDMKLEIKELKNGNFRAT